VLATVRCRAVVAYGEMAEEIDEAIRAADRDDRVRRIVARTMAEAVAMANSIAQPGDVVLLSPAGTSFDQFRDFEERGQRFKADVAALAGSES
jgi:UDP-N-acetylmuramoylalanine--D-glutamate ligase